MKILHLEDNGADAQLVQLPLIREWPDCEITVVSTREDFVAELDRGHDLILSDFSLPQFNGSEALALARARVPEVPFIFVSGNIGEDTAIEAVRAGAQDYVLKDRLKRLVTAIQRALREAVALRHARSLEAERQRLASALESTPDFVGLAAPDGRVLYLNRAARQMIGRPEGKLPAELNIADLHPAPAARQLAQSHLDTAVRDGTWTGETAVVTASGLTLPVSQVIIAHRNAAGAVEYFSTVMRDLTARKQTEALVHGQNQILEMIAGAEPLADTLNALLTFVERQGGELFTSILLLQEDGRELRYCAAPSLPRTYVEGTDHIPVAANAGSCGTAAFRRSPVFVDNIATDPLWASYRHVALSHGFQACWSTPIFDAHHRLLGTFAVYRRQPGPPAEHHRRLIAIATHVAAISISRHETERQLRSQANLLDKASDVIVITDSHDRVTFWNHSAERTLGWTAAEALGRTESDLFGPAAAAEVAAARKATDATEEWRGEVHLHDRQGRPLIMDSRVTVLRDEAGRPQGRLSIATDITEKKRIEEQFFRAQRLESLGMLAAGIAHDLNNILAPILLAAPMLRDSVKDPHDLRMIGTLERSAERGAALVRQILGFAHGADGEHRVVQVKHLLRDVATFVQETFPKSIRLEDQIPSDLWPVNANPTQLHQVLLNLCVNARDAMPNGGILTLRGENRVLDEVAAGEIEGGRPGSFLVLHVQDTGTGIPPGVLPRIWEPFFTTKQSGKGTGLGLSTVRGIIESHAGFATVHSVVGDGTTFRIFLPALEHPTGPAGIPPVAVPVPRGVGELVLVVDDEPGIRNMFAAMLSRHGYRVLTAGDGAEGVALFAPRSKEIRLVVTDLSMPNLDGAALAGVIQRINSAVKIIAISGHGDLPAQTPGQPAFADAFLLKPFRAEALLTTVHELLRTPPNPPA